MDDVPDLLKPVAEAPQETLDPAKEASPLEEAVGVEAEQTLPEMDRISDVPQPMAETPQETLDSDEEASSLEGDMVTEEEIITKMDHAPYTRETIEEETTLEETVSIETLPAEIPEQEDQASVTMDIFPGMGLQKGQEVSTPIE